MKKSEMALFNKEELKLLTQTQAKTLESLDEQDLAKLHTRVRRARDKYSTLYRRQAARAVKRAKARGKASANNAGTSAKSEIFEDALVLVTDRMSFLAHESAAELKDQRLADAQRGKGTKPPADGVPAAPKKSRGKVKGKARAAKRASLKSPKSKKNVASSRAAGARRQAKRDSK